MDSITHVVLGAVMGDVLAGKQLGKRAMVLGAIAQSLPDIDFAASFWLPTADDLLAHRGFTHSFVFAALVTPLMVWWAASVHKPGLSYRSWVFFLGGQVVLHLLLDALNAYGIAWFEPFSHQRYSCNTLFVADPLVTVWLLVATIALIVLGSQNPARSYWSKFGLLMTSLYIVFAIGSKTVVNQHVSSLLKGKGITRYFTTPTPFNTVLWYVVAEDSTGFLTGYRSLFDRNQTLALHRFNRGDALLKPYLERHDVQKLLRFSQGYYVVQELNDTLVFNDLRFGQMAGWSDPGANFAFYYYLQFPDQNDLIVQRGRFRNWNTTTRRELLERIKGN